ncbi:MAG TPA: ATP-binding protein [Candidatus Binatia bacterium]|nr:ATP-binding protein [Candidatus Binatia bacterium]
MRSLLYKLLFSSLLIIVLPMGLAMVWSSKTLSTILERRFAEKSKTQAEQIKLLLSERQETATGLVQWIAEMPGVREALIKNDRAGLFQHLLPLVGSIQLDFIEILDQEGRIFLRVHDPARYGDSPPLPGDIQELLKGAGELSNFGVEERDGNSYLRAAERIDSAPTLGVVSAGYAINRDLVKRLERVAGGKVVIAIGNRLYSVDRTDRGAGRPRTATAKNLLAEDSFWHREGASPALEIRLPLETDRGTEGTISIFFPSQDMTATIQTLQRTLIVVALVGIALALAASWFLSRRLTRPLNELVSGIQQVTAGNYEGAVTTRSRDEIGLLATSFNGMLEELRRSKREVESYRQELERKVAERSKQLSDTEQKRAAMAHMIAHDLKNPLLGIKKTLERLGQTPSELGDGQAKRIFRDLLSAADLVIGMVNEMLDLYRSDFGDIPLSQTSFRIEEIVQASLRILGPDLEEKGLQVRLSSNPPHISAIGDKRRLTRLAINLLSNASKFSPHGGRISISAAIVENNGSRSQLLLRVEDDGLGIPEQDLPRIFDRFYSRDKDKAETGTGLGLPYCKLVAEAHGGSILAENRKHGGFAVSVFLPLHAWKAEGSYAA